MSDLLNSAWLEGIRDSFEVAVAEGDYVLCKEIIQKVRDEGFDAEAKQLQAALVEETIGTFIHETDEKSWN